MYTYFRAPFARTEHLVRPGDDRYTLCALSTKQGAKFSGSDRGPDAKVRPLCDKCRRIRYARS